MMRSLLRCFVLVGGERDGRNIDGALVLGGDAGARPWTPVESVPSSLCWRNVHGYSRMTRW